MPLWSKTGEGRDLYSDDEVEKIGELFKISASGSGVGANASFSDSSSESLNSRLCLHELWL